MEDELIERLNTEEEILEKHTITLKHIFEKYPRRIKERMAAKIFGHDES